MDRVGLLSIISVVVPQNLMLIIFGFLVIGEKRNILFYRNKFNVLKLMTSVLLMTIITVVSRTLAANIIMHLLIMSVTTIAIIKYTYGIRWWKAVIAVLAFVALLITSEMAYLPPIVAYMNRSLSSTYTSGDLVRFYYSIPTVLVYIYAIVSLWNWDVALVSIKKYKENALIYTSFIVTIMLGEALLYYSLFNSFVYLTSLSKIIACAGLFILMIGNSLSFKIITATTKSARLEVAGEVNNFKDEMQQTFDVIHLFIQTGDLESAKEIVDRKNKKMVG